MGGNGRNFEILIVEDSAPDAMILQTLLREGKMGSVCNIRALMTSTDVIPFLRSPRTAYQPDLIIVDYRMPMDGGRAVAELKGDPDFRHIPVIVLTGAVSQQDILDIYLRGANCCYHKPSSLDDYTLLAELIADHWLTRICSPRTALSP